MPKFTSAGCKTRSKVRVSLTHPRQRESGAEVLRLQEQTGGAFGSDCGSVYTASNRIGKHLVRAHKMPFANDVSLARQGVRFKGSALDSP